MIPHINTTNVSFNYHKIIKFIDNLHSLSSLAYQLLTNQNSPAWKICVKKVTTTTKEVNFHKKIDLEKKFKNEQTIFKFIKNFDFSKFNQALNQPTLIQYMDKVFEKNNYIQGEKDIMTRFISLLINSVIESGQLSVSKALKVQDDILGTIAFKKNISSFEIWMKQVAIQCFKKLKRVKDEAILSIPEKCVFYIKDHIDQKLSLDILAQELNCSKSSLVHLFKNKYGKTVNLYINEQKIETAQYMLANSSLNISEIAYILAFNSPNYFMQLFKKHVGITPKTYRNNLVNFN